MMRFSASFALVLTLCLLNQGCSDDDGGVTGPSTVVNGSGNIVQESRSVDSIRSINMASEGSVIITQGDTESLLIRGDDNILPHIITDMSGGNLSIHTEGGYDINPSQSIQFILTVETVGSITFAGVGDLIATDLEVNDLYVVASGVADLSFVHLEADQADFLMSGVGGISASGTVDELNVTLAGVGDASAGDLACNVAHVRIGGQGDATVRVSERLAVLISGMGSVFYIGDPDLEIRITGSGSVTRIGG